MKDQIDEIFTGNQKKIPEAQKTYYSKNLEEMLKDHIAEEIAYYEDDINKIK